MTRTTRRFVIIAVAVAALTGTAAGAVLTGSQRASAGQHGVLDDGKELLPRAGIPLGNQSVLLRGINDDVATMQALCEGLVRMRVRPYYCYQAQLLEGTAHFRVPIERGIEIFRALRGRTSGFAIPQYVLDTPYGKVPISHPFWLGREGDDALFEAPDGRVWRERNPR